jgi:adenylate kinase family enzyme
MSGPRLVIYCDESAKKGPHFSNFYGASITRSEIADSVEKEISSLVMALGLTCEVKWNNISPSTADRFIKVADLFFDHIEAGGIKFRAMFTHNIHVPVGLTDEQRRNAHFLLYYQLIRNGLGLQHYGREFGARDLQLIFDQFPRHTDHVRRFKEFLKKLNNRVLRPSGLELRDENIGEAKSHDHMILQCTDLVIGSMNFRLNDFHRAKADGSKRRGKKTVAKERVFKHMSARIRGIYPNFNIGISTGTQGDITNRWKHPYRHWVFIPKNRAYDETKVKP